MSEENVELVRKGWDAWLRGDPEVLFELFDPEVVWDTSHFRDWPEANYEGTEGVQRFLREWLEVWSDDYEVEVEDVVGLPDGRVLTLLTHRGTGRASGAAMTLPMAQLAELGGGKITRLVNYDDRAEALEAVGLSE